MVVIEMNPRVSRSSALASKATGFPIAKVAAKLAVGYTLDELQNDITGGATPASFEPSIDYVVTKIPRFAFEKFPQANSRLTTQMKSVGEVMAIGRTFQESFQKALRGLEVGVHGLDEKYTDREAIAAELGSPGPDRIWAVGDAFRLGMSVEQVFSVSKIDPWFLVQIEDLIRQEESLTGRTLESLGADELRALKRQRFCRCAPGEVAGRNAKHRRPTAGRSMLLGGGPNRIGQGIEFDYCCVHAALAMREDGYETIMVNCNPETVSTDYDTSDRLYFEPLTLEDVLEGGGSRKANRRDRAVRRPDPAQSGARTGKERRAHHRRRHRT